MYAVVVAIDWFLDHFRTAVNVSGDHYVAPIVTKLTGFTDKDDAEAVDEARESDKTEALKARRESDKV